MANDVIIRAVQKKHLLVLPEKQKHARLREEVLKPTMELEGKSTGGRTALRWLHQLVFSAA